MRGSTGTVYTVTLSDEGNSCQCVDFKIRKHACKHIRHAASRAILAAGTLLLLTGGTATICRLVLMTLKVSESHAWREVRPRLEAWHYVGG